MNTRFGQSLLPIKDVLKNFDSLKNKYISREFQDYGYRLAEELGDLEHKALYIKLAKTMPRKLLEEARNFVKDAANVRNRARLFMWYVTRQRRERTNPAERKSQKR